MALFGYFGLFLTLFLPHLSPFGKAMKIESIPEIAQLQKKRLKMIDFEKVSMSRFQASILYGISGIFERISPFGLHGSIFCTMTIAAVFTAFEGK